MLHQSLECDLHIENGMHNPFWAKKPNNQVQSLSE